MRSIVSSFPGGGAGAGLLVLRGSVALSLLAPVVSVETPPWSIVAAASLAAGLGCGYRTRMLAGLCGSLALYRLTVLPGGDLISFLSLLDAIVLALAGPGAMSIDARLFGRRTIIVSGGADPARTD